MKRDIKGERLLIKKKVKEGPMGNFALPLPPADRKTGEGGGTRRRPWGLGSGHGEGEKGERASGNLFPTSIWAGAQREGRSTAVGGDGHGGSGSGARGREVLGWAELRVVGAPGVLLGPFYRRPRWWRRGAATRAARRVGGRPGEGKVAGSAALARCGRRGSVACTGARDTATRGAGAQRRAV